MDTNVYRHEVACPIGYRGWIGTGCQGLGDIILYLIAGPLLLGLHLCHFQSLPEVINTEYLCSRRNQGFILSSLPSCPFTSPLHTPSDLSSFPSDLSGVPIQTSLALVRMKNAFRGPHLYQGYVPILYPSASPPGILVIKYKVALWGCQEGGDLLCGWTVREKLDHLKEQKSPNIPKPASSLSSSNTRLGQRPLPYCLNQFLSLWNQEAEMPENCGVCSVTKKSSSKAACLLWPACRFSVPGDGSNICGKCSKRRTACSLGCRPWQARGRRKALDAERPEVLKMSLAVCLGDGGDHPFWWWRSGSFLCSFSEFTYQRYSSMSGINSHGKPGCS